MSATLSFSNANPTASDTILTTLQKILVYGGTGAIASGGAVLSSNGPPTADPGVDSAINYDLDSGITYHWNDATGAWV